MYSDATEPPPFPPVDWAPTIDGVELSESPQILGARGLFNKDVDIVLGTNKDEASTFLSMIPHDATVAVMNEKVHEQIGSLAPGALELYPVAEYKNPWWAAIDIFTDGMFTCPARRMALNVVKHGGKSARLYFMTWELLLARFDEWLGVFHGNELAFVFRDALAVTPGVERALMEAVSTYWTQIAVKGDPNQAPFPDWPAFNAEDQAHLDINPFSLAGMPMAGERARRCDWWDAVLAVDCHPFPLGGTCANPPPVPPKA
jgi:carboxylesterase type B